MYYKTQKAQKVYLKIKSSPVPLIPVTPYLDPEATTVSLVFRRSLHASGYIFFYYTNSSKLYAFLHVDFLHLIYLSIVSVLSYRAV